MESPDNKVLCVHSSYSFTDYIGQQMCTAPCTCHEIACDPGNIICTSILSIHPSIMNVYSIILLCVDFPSTLLLLFLDL